MYAGRLWTMRQYAGFGTAQETNQRFRQLLAAGQMGLSTAFDLPPSEAQPQISKVNQYLPLNLVVFV